MKQAKVAMSTTLVFAILYCAWVFGNRYLENRQIEKDENAAEAQAAALPRQYQGNEVKILQFYSPRPASVCYGVVNAKSVQITPEVGDTAPSVSRCVDVHPAKSTEYTIKAQAANGTTATQTLVVKPGS